MTAWTPLVQAPHSTKPRSKKEWEKRSDKISYSQIEGFVRQILGWREYAHHIQRLMITGNFALLAGIDPDEVDSWYLGIYIDALCAGCFYDKNKRVGERACPFNSLYWEFFARNEKKLRGNPRIAIAYKNLDRIEEL